MYSGGLRKKTCWCWIELRQCEGREAGSSESGGREGGERRAESCDVLGSVESVESVESGERAGLRGRVVSRGVRERCVSMIQSCRKCGAGAATGRRELRWITVREWPVKEKAQPSNLEEQERPMSQIEAMMSSAVVQCSKEELGAGGRMRKQARTGRGERVEVGVVWRGAQKRGRSSLPSTPKGSGDRYLAPWRRRTCHVPFARRPLYNSTGGRRFYKQMAQPRDNAIARIRSSVAEARLLHGDAVMADATSTEARLGHTVGELQARVEEQQAALEQVRIVSHVFVRLLISQSYVALPKSMCSKLRVRQMTHAKS